jgi:hypothetical protein
MPDSAAARGTFLGDFRPFVVAAAGVLRAAISAIFA